MTHRFKKCLVMASIPTSILSNTDKTDLTINIGYNYQLMKLTSLSTCNNSVTLSVKHVGLLLMLNAVCSTNLSLLVHMMDALLSCALLNNHHD